MKSRNLFLPASIVAIGFGLVLWLFAPGIAVTSWANQHHHSFLDTFFKNASIAAEWILIVIPILYAFRFGISSGIAAGLVFIMESITVNGLKYIVKATRPIVEIGESNLHPVPDVAIHQFQSFPSGHTAVAFLGFGILGTLIPYRPVQVFCAAAAASIGYSRMYLGQHYLIDVLAGAGISLCLVFLFTKIQFRIPFLKPSQK